MANTVLATRPPSAVNLSQWWRKLRRRHVVLGISVFLLLLVAGTGILAPLIAPHDPHKGNLADQKLPPAWIGERTTAKTIVEFPEPGLSHRQISIARAQRIDPNAALGGEVTVILREGGSPGIYWEPMI